MSIYHCSIKNGSRAKGQSAIAAAAYRSGSKLTDKEVGIVSDYTRKGGVVFSEISLCNNAPAEYADRETLWNAVHEIEKAKNARLWREIEVALPIELSREEQIATVRQYVAKLVEKGMCADWSLHDKGDGNPHAHIMLTVRSIKDNGEWAPKSRKVYDLDKNGERIFQKVDKSGRKQYKSHKEDYNDWNAKERVEEWRAAWAECCNERLAERDHIDYRSYERQGAPFEPTKHEGYVARKIASEGRTAPVIEYNKGVQERNSLLKEIWQQLKELAVQIQQLTQQLNQNKGSEISGRISDLLSRRSRAVANAQRGTTNGERTAERADRGAISDDTAAFLRQTSLDETHTATEKRNSSIETAAHARPSERPTDNTEALVRKAAAVGAVAEKYVASSTASRTDRNAERERQAAESRRRAEEERRRVEEENRRAAEKERERAERKRKSYRER